VTLILSVTLVSLLTFVVMPLLVRAFGPWLRAGTAGSVAGEGETP
jgi:antibiotic biosynthesis monooxygenase (ABM) superfamily enzyme